jgi:hypothetical protein
MLISMVLTGILAGVTYAATSGTDWFVDTKWVWLSLSFFFLLTNLVFFMVSNAIGRRNQTFIYAMGGSMGLRFILSIGFILSYLQFGGEREIGIIVYFMLMYLLYTIFEIYFILANLRAAKNDKTGDTKN